MTKQDAIDIGFKTLETALDSEVLYCDIGRDRTLSLSDIGESTECLHIREAGEGPFMDVVTINVSALDGGLTKTELELLVKTLTR